MAATIRNEDGSLNFVAAVDTSDLDSMSKKIEQELQAIVNATERANTAVESTGSAVADSFDSTKIQQYGDQVVRLYNSVTAFLQDSFGFEKLQALDSELNKTTTEAEKLSLVLQFFKENASDINNNSESAKTFLGNLGELQKSLSQVNQTKVSDSIDEADDKAKDLDQTIQDIGESATTAQTRLAEIKNTLATMSPGDPGFQPLMEEAAGLENRIENVNRGVGLMGSNNSGTEALKQGINGLVGAFAAASSGIALVTGDENKLQETMVKLFAVLQIVAGAEQFLGLVSKKSAANQELLAMYRRLTGQVTAEQAAATEAATLAEGTNAAATEEATAAQWSLNAAIDANPVGAAIVALTALIGIISLYVGSLNEADEKQIRINESMAESVQLINDLAALQNRAFADRAVDAQNAVSLAQAQGKSEREILDLKLQANQAERAAANELAGYLMADKKQLDLLETKLGLRKEEINSIILAEEASGKLTDKEKKRLELLQSEVKYIEAQANAARAANGAVDNANQKNLELNAEKVRQQREAGIRSATASAEAGAINAVPGTQAALDAQIAAIRAQQRATLSNVNITAGERVKAEADAENRIDELKRSFRIAQIADQEAAAKAILAASMAGSTEEFNARASLIDLDAKKQLEQEGITANKRLQIQNETIKAQSELSKKYNFDITQTALGEQIATTNTRLAQSKKGSDEELQLRKSLIDKQANLDIASAQNSILNTELLAAKEKQIHAQSLVDKKKLDDTYADKRLQQELAGIKSTADQANSQYEKTLNSPVANNNQKYQAQRTILENQQTALLQMWLKADQAAHAATGNTEKAAQEAAKFKKELDETGNAIDNLDTGHLQEVWEDTVGVLQQVGGTLSSLGNEITQYNSGLGETISGLGSLLSQVGNIQKALSNKTSSIDKIGLAVQSTINLVTLVTSAAAQRAAAESEFNQGLINQQLQYNHALNDAILLNAKLKGNVFLVNYQGQLRDGINALTDAQKKYQDSIKALSAGQAKAGQRNAVSGSAILQGAGYGAVAGATLGPIGAAVGAVVGGLIGLFGGKKKKDSYVSLLQEYPELVKQTDDGILEINKDLAQTLINNKLVSDATKTLIQDTLDWQAAIDKANEQIKGIISDLAGDLGGDLRSSLVDAFEQGTSSAKAFAQSVQKTLDKVLSQMIFNNVFGSAFDDLQKKMQDSFKAGGDNNWEDDLTNFFNNYVGLSNKFNEQLTEAQKAAEKAGLSIFQNPNAANEANTLRGAIKGITEQQADLLAGQFGGLRITGMEQVQIMNQNLAVLNAIKSDTANLIDIKADIRKMTTTGVKLIK